MNIDLGMLAIAVSGVLSLIAFAFGYGILTNKVTNNKRNIDRNETASIGAFNSLKEDNKVDHEHLYKKFEELSGDVRGIKMLLNGKKNGS